MCFTDKAVTFHASTKNMARVTRCVKYDIVLVPKGERKYFTFGFSRPSELCAKSKIMIKELQFFGKDLPLTLGLMAEAR